MNRRHATLLGTLGLPLWVPTVEAKDLSDLLGRGFAPVAEAFARSVVRSLPVVAASPGVSFEFDPETGVFERKSATGGQLFIERAETLGPRHWNFSLSYQFVRFDSFEGHDLHNLSDRRPVVAPDGVPLFLLPHSEIDVDAHEATASLTYGLSDRVDLNLTVPVIRTSLERSDEVIDLSSGLPVDLRSHASAATAGIGDILLRTKVRLGPLGTGEQAAGSTLTLPTGDRGDFHGEGAPSVAPAWYLSGPRWPLGGRMAMQAHLNVGMDFSTADFDQSEGRWGAGVDLSVGEVQLALGLLGRHQVGRLAERGVFDTRRCLDPLARCLHAPADSHKGDAAIFGFDGGREDFVDVSIGGRISLWRDTLLGFANILVPVTADGLGTEPIPTVGLEAAF